jgi:hypothetical protein
MGKYSQNYGDEFCLVINCSTEFDSAFVLPFASVKEIFAKEYLSGPRWIGTVINERLRVSLGGKPVNELYVGKYYNAFQLLHDAPQPVPTMREYR